MTPWSRPVVAVARTKKLQRLASSETGTSIGEPVVRSPGIVVQQKVRG